MSQGFPFYVYIWDIKHLFIFLLRLTYHLDYFEDFETKRLKILYKHCIKNSVEPVGSTVYLQSSF